MTEDAGDGLDVPDCCLDWTYDLKGDCQFQVGHEE
jgi:hypothetical protein